MRVAIINSTCGIGSTGKICVSLSNILSNNGIDNKIFYTQDISSFNNSKKYSFKVYKKIQALKARVFGNWGFNSKISTKILINELKHYKPTVIHLHNIHSHDCNIEQLFKYISANKIKVFWTFHDCWAFTGYCTHFIYQKCYKWKACCEKCIQFKKFSWFFDKSKSNFLRKKACIDQADLIVITPSVWLSHLVADSFFSKKRILVINNGIDLGVFKPTFGNFRKKYGIGSDQYMILGVSFIWSNQKGIDVFLKLSKDLPDCYRIVLVGVNKQLIKKMPKSIICIERTSNQEELAEIYTSADILINPTREENYPTIHLESLACGTPVISFDTGGCKEMLDESCGATVPTDDYDLLKSMMINACENHMYSQEKCLEKAKQFDENVTFNKYLDLYKELRDLPEKV